jgi:8-oxo-dGTP pyrophosphatase MutT (NUDIX family)
MKNSMKRDRIIKLLEEYLPATAEERIFKEETISFIKKHENCFERSLKIGHITASALLLNKDKTKALLMHHTKLDKWLQLGGHCDGNPNALEVALKEAREESGIKGIAPVSDKIFDLDIHLIPKNSREDEHYHYDIRFLLYVTSDEEIIQNHEAKELRWIGACKDETPTTNPSVLRMLAKWISMI